MGRDDVPAQKREKSTFPVKEEKASRTDEETQFKWGTDTHNKSKPSKANANGDRNSESAANTGDSAGDSVPIEKEKPNFGLSGKLTAETNTVHGVVIAYAEPPGARKPKRRWRLYPFKGEQALPTLYIHRQSCYLIGRDRKVCDIPVDHPSCSKQHAVLQYRLVPYERVDGTKSQCVRPYIIDLESSNGTFVNNKKIETKRYLELREKDVLKFGFSSREYVLLHENSKEDNEDDEGYDASPVKKRASSDSTKVETK
uniref:FHA domain-containing protein n=1 Tax=Anopheles maculatus TaxID=74869 RepID=A0A182SUS3_9DIPT